MDFTYKTRQFYPDELRLLKTLKTKQDKKSETKIKLYHFFIAGLLGIAFTYLATLTKVGFLVFLFGTLAVFAYGFIVFMPYEMYKLRKKQKAFSRQLNSFIEKGTVDTCFIKATRIAVAREYEDEGDLFIIEYDAEKVLYLWDYDCNLKKKFPCLDFEIYEENFCKLLGRQVYPKSEPIDPITIDKQAKWNYMKKVGAPEHLSKENVNFDKLVADVNNCA